jgi:hypothetical protein
MKKDKCKINALFNRLLVIEEPFSVKKQSANGRTSTKWKCLCRCDCGNEKFIECSALVDNKTKSCGCLNLENVKIKGRGGKYSDKNIIKHPLYSCFKSMKNTCRNNPQIKICELWVNNFEEFYKWAIGKWSDGNRLSRINTNLDFNPNNCTFRKIEDIANENLEKSRDKIRQTHIDKYGGWYTQTNECKKQNRETCIEKYGYESVTQVPEFKEKSRDTCLDKYGTMFANQSPDVKEKIRLTCQEKYGANSPTQNPEIRQKQIDVCIEKYGVPFFHKTKLIQQNQIKDWLLSEGFVFESDYSVLENKEIDLYNNGLKIGIEYCGLRWHSESKSKNGKNKHYDKYLKCKENGVRLLTIFADEWLERNTQIKSFILSALNKVSNKYHGRKCAVSIIDKTDGIKFLEKYHIQGAGIKNVLFVGIKYNDELIGVTSFNYHHRNNTDFVLNRLAFKTGVRVIGGFSKMLHLAIEYCKQNNITKIVTWSDNRWSTGEVYEKCGFKFDKNLPVDYTYINVSNPKKRLSKQSCKKKNIKCPEDKTEYEYMLELGFDRIWDCGKKRFVLEIT